MKERIGISAEAGGKRIGRGNGSDLGAQPPAQERGARTALEVALVVAEANLGRGRRPALERGEHGRLGRGRELAGQRDSAAKQLDAEAAYLGVGVDDGEVELLGEDGGERGPDDLIAKAARPIGLDRHGDIGARPGI